MNQEVRKNRKPRITRIYTDQTKCLSHPRYPLPARRGGSHVPGDANNHFNAAGLEVMASRMLPEVEKLIGSAGRH
jgi:hypothetical protein